MDNFDKLAQLFKEKSFFKEILYVALGLLFIFLSNLFFEFDVNTIANYKYFNSFSQILFLVVISYFLCKISYEIGAVLLKVTFFIMQKKRKEKFIKFCKNFDNFVNSDTYAASEDNLRNRHIDEVIEEFSNSKYLKADY